MPDLEDIDLSFDMHNPAVLDFIKERGFDFWDGTSETTKTKLKEVLSKATVEGLTTEQVIALVQIEVFNELTEFADFNRARRIARTETTISLNQGADFAYRQSGVVKKKSWLTSKDEVVRTSHTKAEQQGPINYGQVFRNRLRFPGDPDGALKEIVNCRCTLIPEVDVKAVKRDILKLKFKGRN